MNFFGILLIFGFGVLSASAYIPASPTNDTEKAVRDGGLPVNQSDVSTLNLLWFPTGSYELKVSYQLAGAESNGLSKGVLLHFSEDNVNETTSPTTTPWIALVNCDRNSTDSSDNIDIFTLAQDKGAVAAVLYSLSYEACIINPEYADPNTFNQVFDIYSTKSLLNSALIDYQFGQLSYTPGSKSNKNKTTTLSSYDSKRLNDSYQVIEDSIAANMARGSGFLFATLRAYNSTANDTTTQALPDPNFPSSPPPPSRSNGTSSAMIVLYTITGCVSALFIAVIVSGAIRAIRHPERYGPRAFDTGPGSGGFMPAHARGLTRAIVDTFPIFKFSSTGRVPTNEKDVESRFSTPPHSRHTTTSMADVEMVDWVTVQARLSQDDDDQKSRKDDKLENTVSEAGPSSPARRDTNSEVDKPEHSLDDVVPDAIGHETCPICIVDFEEGDDLRMLPCEGKHIFHQTCVDPWLLELSSSCPLCRQDFAALESMLAGSSPSDGESLRPQSGVPHDLRHTGMNRFSRYLRLAKHKRRRATGQTGQEPVEPLPPPPPPPPPIGNIVRPSSSHATI